MQIVNEPGFDYYVGKIRDREPLIFVRWGDGEWTCMAGGQGFNCNEELYTQSLKRSLLQAFASLNLYSAIQPYSLKNPDVRRLIDLVMDDNGFYDRGFYPNADVFHEACLNGQLKPLLDALQSRPTFWIGNEYLTKWVRDNFPEAGGLTVSLTKAAANIDEAIERTANILTTQAMREETLICICAGMAGKVMAHRLVRDLGVKHLVDFGSVFDVFSGRKSRGAYARMSNETIAKNLGYNETDSVIHGLLPDKSYTGIEEEKNEFILTAGNKNLEG
jgi:hypothetical protein